tara:strand:- start:511 stop:921 length:411 start_codon:yes stop_codon:yes gene_type:complete
MESKKYVLDAPIWNGGNRYVGIAPFRLKKNNLKISCRYRNKQGKPIRGWEGELFLSKRFADRYEIKTFKYGKLYLIPLDDLIEFNEQINAKLREMKKKTWSNTYTKTEINQILLENKNISDICKMFPGCQIEPNPS